MIAVRWTVAGLLAALFVLLALGNGSIAFRAFVLKQKAPSWIPLIGGVAGAIAFIVVPIGGLWMWAWIPLLLDWGSIPGLMHTALFWLFVVPRLPRDG
ncbi:MAG: hypothetical protein KDB90_10880 [Planctomycetes bacterium]|nr:hypothetical protein [Planctomycetota bacterium]